MAEQGIEETPELLSAENVPKDWALFKLVRPLIAMGLNLMQRGPELDGLAGFVYGVDPTSNGPQAGVPLDLQNMQSFAGFVLPDDVADVTNSTLLIDSTNAKLYAGRIVPFNRAGGVVVTVDATAGNGFNFSAWQIGAGQVTIVAGSGLTLRNWSGHNKTAGQWAIASVFMRGSDLGLAGITST